MFLANIGHWVRLKNHNRLNSNKKSTSSCFPSLIAILPFFIDSKVSILLLVSRSRTISEPKVVRFSMSRMELSRSVGTRGTTSILWIRSRSSETRISRQKKTFEAPLSLKRLAQLSRLNGVKYHFEQSCVSRSRRRLADSFWRANFSLLSGGEIKMGKIVENELRISRNLRIFTLTRVYLVRKICWTNWPFYRRYRSLNLLWPINKIRNIKMKRNFLLWINSGKKRWIRS